jgi:hypothetical protein
MLHSIAQFAVPPLTADRVRLLNAAISNCAVAGIEILAVKLVNPHRILDRG